MGGISWLIIALFCEANTSDLHFNRAMLVSWTMHEVAPGHCCWVPDAAFDPVAQPHDVSGQSLSCNA